jgi:hypothetical protein
MMLREGKCPVKEKGRPAHAGLKGKIWCHRIVDPWLRGRSGVGFLPKGYASASLAWRGIAFFTQSQGSDSRRISFFP